MENTKTQPSRSKQQVVSCDHYWSYPQTVWSGRDGHDEVVVARYCSKCGKTQCASASNWHKIPKGYVAIEEYCAKEAGLSPAANSV